MKLPWITLLFLYFSSINGWASESPLKLIQTAENEVRWMNDAEIAIISKAQHAAGKCGGFMDISDHPELALEQEPLRTSLNLDLEDFRFTQHQAISSAFSHLSAEQLSEHVKNLSAFPNRYYESDSGVNAAKWIHTQFKTFAQDRSDIQVQFFQHRWKQPSVIARIQGSGPRASEIVVIGAHEDSINRTQSSGISPGADDDASGVATLLEIYRSLVEIQFIPDRTLEFITYAAEEVGLKGSQDIALLYKKEKKQVMGVLQFDMTMFPSKSKVVTMIEDHVDPSLTHFISALIDEYVKVPWKNDTCGYACSDHASWTRAGFPSAFPFEAPFDEYNHNIHTPKDTLDILDSEFGLHFAKIGIAFAIEMSSKK